MRRVLIEPLVQKLRQGGRSVFYDQASATGVFPDDILNGILSTRGGGVALFLVSRTYLKEEWTQIEMACAYAARDRHDVNHLRLLVVCLDVIPEQIADRPFVQRFCNDADQPLQHFKFITLPAHVQRDNPASLIAFIDNEVQKRLETNFVPGATKEQSFGNLSIKLQAMYRNDAATIESICVTFNLPLVAHETLLSVLQRAKDRQLLSPDKVSSLLDALDVLGLTQGAHMVRRYQDKWLDPWIHAPVPDLHQLKQEVLDWRNPQNRI